MYKNHQNYQNAVAWIKPKQRHFLISASFCSMGNPYPGLGRRSDFLNKPFKHKRAQPPPVAMPVYIELARCQQIRYGKLCNAI